MNDAHLPGPVDPVLLRGLTGSRVGRRDVFKLFGGLAGAAVLAGCGGIEAQGKKTDTSKSAF
jgi:hypothetical protein